MKKILIGVGAVLLVTALAYPVFGWGPRWGGNPVWGDGHSRWGNWDRGYKINLTIEQRRQMFALLRKYYEETTPIRNDIRSKTTELTNVLTSEYIDEQKVKALYKDIHNHMSDLEKKEFVYKLEVHKMVPDARYTAEYDRGSGFIPRREYNLEGYDRPMVGFAGRGYGYDPGTF